MSTPMEILTDAEIMAEFKMNKNFIDRHAKEMGSRGRPRTFLRMNVERFVAVYYSDQLMESLAKKSDDLKRAALLEDLKLPAFTPMSVPSFGCGKIMRKGVRQRSAA